MPASLTIGEFDPLTWINEYTTPAISITSETYEPIMQFSLMWGLFERNACMREATVATIEKSVDSAFAAGLLEAGNFQEHLEYFKNRATRNGNTIEAYFKALVLTNDRAKRMVRGALDGTLKDANNVVLALLLIAHRVRNNLFHGSKDVAVLHSQVELFKAVNSLLATYLSSTKSLHIKSAG